MVKPLGFGVIQLTVMGIIGFVTLGKLSKLIPSLFHELRIIKSICFTGILCRGNSIIYLKYLVSCLAHIKSTAKVSCVLTLVLELNSERERQQTHKLIL